MALLKIKHFLNELFFAFLIHSRVNLYVECIDRVYTSHVYYVFEKIIKIDAYHTFFV